MSPSAKDLRVHNHSVAVVGGGLAGLTAAVELAHGGRDVTLYDQASNLGGRAMTRQVAAFRFNMGPRALYAHGAAQRILAELGVRFSGHRPALKGGKAWFGGAVESLPVDPMSIVRCSWLPWKSKFQVMALFARLPKLDLTPWHGRSMAEWLQTTLTQPRARDWMVALLRLTTYSAYPEGLDAATTVRQLQLGVVGGVLYLDDGWQTLVQGLSDSARHAGVRTVAGQRVQAVQRQGDAWALRLADGAVAEAGAVVLAVAPSVVDKLLGDALPAATAELLARLRPVDAACLDVALRNLPRPEATFALGIDRPLYYSVHSKAARLAPEGGALVHVLRYLNDDSAATRGALEKELESVLDELQPGWREVLVDRQLMPRMRVCHALHDAGVERPGERLEGLPGIYLAGDWVGDEGLLADAAVCSGQKAARQLLARSTVHAVAA